jgi:hypothetical protein
MKAIQKVIYTGFAAVALASASMPVFPAVTLASTDARWRGVDFEWYASVGRPMVDPLVVVQPAPREGYIWSPAHWEWNGRRHVLVEGHWIADDYARQLALHDNLPPGTVLAEAPLQPREIIIERR